MVNHEQSPQLLALDSEHAPEGIDLGGLPLDVRARIERHILQLQDHDARIQQVADALAAFGEW